MSSARTHLIQQQVLASKAARFGFAPRRRHLCCLNCRFDQVVPGCSAAGSQLVPQCPPDHASLASPSLTEDSARDERKPLLQVLGSLACIAVAILVLAVSGGLSGLAVRFKQHIAATSAASGFAAGFLHTLCGPDHLAALTPLTIGRNRFTASLLGSLWGMGHSAGQLVLGLAFVLLKSQFTMFLPFLEKFAGTVVGLTVLTIGGLGIYESVIKKNEEDDSEGEAQLKDIVDSDSGQLKVAAATFGTGVLHGLQPDSLFVIIPALALPSSLAAFAYCSMFVIGTVLAMGGYTLFLGTASEELCKNRPWLEQNLSFVASCAAILVGAMVILSAFGVAVPL